MSLPDLRIDHDSQVPPYEQVRQHVVERVESGELEPGHRLPPVRTLAAEAGLAANTVAKAYKELEALGVVETRGRAGTFVAGRGVEAAARGLASSYVAEARRLGLSDRDLLAHVRRALG